MNVNKYLLTPEGQAFLVFHEQRQAMKIPPKRDPVEIEGPVPYRCSKGHDFDKVLVDMKRSSWGCCPICDEVNEDICRVTEKPKPAQPEVAPSVDRGAQLAANLRAPRELPNTPVYADFDNDPALRGDLPAEAMEPEERINAQIP